MDSLARRSHPDPAQRRSRELLSLDDPVVPAIPKEPKVSPEVPAVARTRRLAAPRSLATSTTGIVEH
jgi:hypothetical protein